MASWSTTTGTDGRVYIADGSGRAMLFHGFNVKTGAPATDVTDQLLAEREGNILVLTLNRPDAGNSLSTAMIAALQAALDDAIADDRVHVVVIDAAGGKPPSERLVPRDEEPDPRVDQADKAVGLPEVAPRPAGGGIDGPGGKAWPVAAGEHRPENTARGRPPADHPQRRDAPLLPT